MNVKTPMNLLENAVNRYLTMDPEMAQRINNFEGRVIAVDITGYDSVLYLFPAEGKIRIDNHHEAEADTTLKGSPAALFKMGMSSNVAPMMLSGEIEISGDVRLGREFKKLFNEIEIDWEEHLSTVVGDVAANRLMHLTKTIGNWGRDAATSFAADVSEYLTEESRDVVSAAELEMFYQDVDYLRNDVDRLEARLEERIKG